MLLKTKDMKGLEARILIELLWYILDGDMSDDVKNGYLGVYRIWSFEQGVKDKEFLMSRKQYKKLDWLKAICDIIDNV